MIGAVQKLISEKSVSVLDSHSHRESAFAIVHVNALTCLEQEGLRKNNINYSLGIHPWDASKIDSRHAFELLSKQCEILDPVAIGETGLDRMKMETFDIQKQLLEQHLLIAQERDLSVIIHCVRSWSDLIPYFLKFNFLRYIFHDFRGNDQQINKLLTFNSYFSFGKSVLQPSEKLKNSIKKIPIERILTETDDSNYSIDVILHAISTILQMPFADMIKQIEGNTKQAYNL